ncbi:Cytokinin riboside 5'-monophosphate phosphoribohydrolase LOG3 [Capsicum baccatum]|uniref:Cytokinin riboside 5'-monophosphate phosphoribohydrolase n=1 Tax=Capsicum baccatum TaxID=33114 RepID=A0A2G2X372_CAPBA|nr:Cytokinin riboside 5'-monophosphate phosphoribohydrolase LOG3 [Capsicum baccatum]
MEMKSDVMVSKFKRICVFCGSSSQGKKNSYQDAAIELGKELVLRNIDLVYGGGSIGLMGLVSQAVHDGGRHVIGVVPKTLMPRELTGEIVGEVKVQKWLGTLDAFIALPGGYGTLDELLEVISWAQLGIHISRPNACQIIIAAPRATELVEKLEEYVPCHERVASKLNWETKQQLGYPQAQEIAR